MYVQRGCTYLETHLILFFSFVLIIVFGSDGDEVVVLIMMHSFMIYILYIHVSPIGKS